MYKVTIYSPLTMETLWTKYFHGESKAEAYAEYYFDPEGNKGFGRCLASTWEHA